MRLDAMTHRCLGGHVHAALAPASATRPNIAPGRAAGALPRYRTPNGLFLSVLVAICDALEVTPAELIVTEAHNSAPRPRQRHRLGDLASRRPTHVRFNRDR